MKVACKRVNKLAWPEVIGLSSRNVYLVSSCRLTSRLLARKSSMFLQNKGLLRVKTKERQYGTV